MFKMKTWMRCLIIGIAIFVIAFFMMNFEKKITANAIKEQEHYQDWLFDNCNCTAYERLKCRAPYELEGEHCKYENKITFAIEACSQFDCSDEIVNWNGNKWVK